MDYQMQIPPTMCVSKVALAAGTTSTLSTTGTTLYCIRGKAYSKGALTNQATPVTDFATGKAFLPVPALNASMHVVGFDAAGNLQCCQGPVTPLNQQTGAFLQAPQLGGWPLNFCPIGYLIIQASSAASSTPGWTFGTSNMSAVTGITYLFQDLMSWPDRPQTS